jgi:DNA-directed RNA polymerase I, II, and III subunit RPABC2
MSDKMYYDSDIDSDNNSINSDNDSDNEINTVENKPKILKTDIDDADILDINEDQDQDVDEDADPDVDADDADQDVDDADQDVDEDADQDVDEDEEDADDDESINYENITEKKNIKKTKSTASTSKKLVIYDEENDDDDDEINENYLEKFDTDLVKNYIDEFHPECLNHNYDEISKMSIVVKNSDGIIIDPFHKTIPYLTKYERARILGQRAKQIETGAKPFVNVSENIIDSYTIAELELKEKKIPFIIKRPIPGGGFEYWNIKDLEIISF